MHHIILLIPIGVAVAGILEWIIALRKPPRRWR